MSADNWATCPRCKEKAEKAQDDLIKRLEVDYGKIPAEEYLKLVEQAKQPFEPIEQTLREDYCIGIWDGKFSASYRARCTKCSFSYTFEPIEKKVC